MSKTKTKIAGLILTFLVLTIGLAQTVHAAPPSISFCTENDTSEGNTKICKGGTKVTCDNTTVNNTSTDSKSMCEGGTWKYCNASTKDAKSPDGKLTCDGLTWKTSSSSTPPSINIPAGSNPLPPTTCTNGDTQSDDSKICQNNTFITCDASKEGNPISGKKCTSGKWVTPSGSGGTNGGGSNNGGTNSGGTQNPQTPTAKITKVTVDPASFKPATDNTKISYTTSLKAIIDIKITNSQGQAVATLTDNQTLNASTYFVTWYGTKDNKKGGTVLNSGTYTYKIVAKNVQTNKVEDSKEGKINLVFGGQEQVVEDKGETKTNTLTAEELAAQAKATLALQNAKKGKTAKVGPDVLIYSVLPVIGYFVSRRRK